MKKWVFLGWLLLVWGKLCWGASPAEEGGEEYRKALVAAGSRGVVGCIELIPGNIRARMVDQQNSSLVSAVRNLHQQGGVPRFFRGGSYKHLKSLEWVHRYWLWGALPPLLETKFGWSEKSYSALFLTGMILPWVDLLTFPIKRFEILTQRHGRFFVLKKRDLNFKQLMKGWRPYTIINTVTWINILLWDKALKAAYVRCEGKEQLSPAELLSVGFIVGLSDCVVRTALSPLNVLCIQEMFGKPASQINYRSWSIRGHRRNPVNVMVGRINGLSGIVSLTMAVALKGYFMDDF